MSMYRCVDADVGALSVDPCAVIVYFCPPGAVNFRFPVSGCHSNEIVSDFRMSISRLFSIIGDSNVRNNMTPFNIRDRPGISDAQILSAHRLDVLPDALRSVRTSSDIVILSCITNYLTSSTEESSSVSGRVYPIMAEFRQHVESFCSSRATTMVMVAPPMYRVLPYWYNTALPEILIEFSSVFIKNRPANLRLLESFPTPEFLPDGVHLTAYSGLRLVFAQFCFLVPLR